MGWNGSIRSSLSVLVFSAMEEQARVQVVVDLPRGQALILISCPSGA